MNCQFFEFFNTNAVKQKIKTNTLSQIQLFLYFYIITLFDFIGSTQQSLSLIGKSPTIVDYLNIWELPIIAAIGLIALYLTNGGNSGVKSQVTTVLSHDLSFDPTSHPKLHLNLTAIAGLNKSS